MAEVVIDGVHKSFGLVEVLKGITMSVERGEVTALIGRSGSGKSTLLRCMNGLESIQKGTITIAGHVVGPDKAKLRALRRDVGIVFQSYNLFPHLSVGDNITLRAAHREEDGPGRGAIGRRGVVLALVGLGDRIGAYPDELSGGQQQRVAIAPVARHAAQGHAVRRGDVRPRSRTHRRGAGRDGAPRARRHDHAARHPRDGLRASRRRHDGVHASGPHPRGRPVAAAFRRSAGRPRWRSSLRSDIK